VAAKVRERSAELHLDALHRDAEDARDLRIGELVLPTKHDDEATPLGKRSNDRAELVGDIGSLEVGIGEAGVAPPADT